MGREGFCERKTRETYVRVYLNIDDHGHISVNTSIRFLDHMLETFLFYAKFSGEIHAEELKSCGDDHHIVEDVAICLGNALNNALGDRSRIKRFGWSIIPMDDALCLTSVDLCSRVYFKFNYRYRREKIGDISTENIVHFLNTFTTNLKATIHIKVLDGFNEHHITEAIFKSLGISINEASRIVEHVQSTKGIV